MKISDKIANRCKQSPAGLARLPYSTHHVPARSPIYILGPGNLGQFVGHGLQSKSKGDSDGVRLLFHRPGLVKEWVSAGSSITLVADDKAIRRSGFGTEFVEPQPQPGPVIKNLIVSTKAYHTVPALRSILHRLTGESDILLLQNGMGTLEEIENVGLFSGSVAKPTFYSGICTHGVNSASLFQITHAGRGTITVGPITPRYGESGGGGESSYLIQKLLEVERFQCTLVSAPDLRRTQLEKLMVNALINPLTVLLDSPNGAVARIQETSLVSLFEGLLREAGAVVRALLAELDLGMADREEEDFSDASLRARVLAVAELTSENISSMLQDVRAGRKTEIDYINGYIFSQARRLGLNCNTHLEIIDRVKAFEPWRES